MPEGSSRGWNAGSLGGDNRGTKPFRYIDQEHPENDDAVEVEVEVMMAGLVQPIGLRPWLTASWPPSLIDTSISLEVFFCLFGGFNGLDFLRQLSRVKCRGSSAGTRELRSASARGSRFIRCSRFFIWSICDGNRFLASLD